jgi:hypothetical protein
MVQILHRPALVYGVDVFDFKFLSGFSRTVSKLAGVIYLPLLMALGIGLTITNTRAVLEAIMASRPPSRALPNTASNQRQTVSAQKKYRAPGMGPVDRTPDRNLFRTRHLLRHRQRKILYGSFLMLFVIGYWVTGLMSLLQGRFAGLSVGGETHTAVPGGRVGAWPSQRP